jgi:hypothetical protein
MLFRPRLPAPTPVVLPPCFSFRNLLLFSDSLLNFTKIRSITRRRLVLDPKSEPENGEQKDASEVLSLGKGLDQPDSPTDKSMEISVERKIDLVSDPNYPSYEILLEVAGKLLESFEKH